MTFLPWFRRLLLGLVLATPLSGNTQAIEGQSLPSTDPFCFREGRLLQAALRDGFNVRAEARSDTPTSDGARVYLVANDESHSLGIIGSVAMRDEPVVQCNWGKGPEVKIEPTREPVRNPSAEPLNKLTKLCRPLAEYLERLAGGHLEVPFRRISLNPDVDLLVTRSPRTGSWSLLQIDKRGGSEVACFSNWGRNFRVPGESPDMRTASLR